MEKRSEIQEFYKDCNLFITGATGFLGKLLIEKLLRSTNVAKIYILVREKKGKQIQCRVDELLDNLIFDALRREHPKFHTKIEAIAGDSSLPGLGISQQDREKLVSNVHIIFHMAATVSLNENIKLAYNINVKATKEVVKLSRQMPQIKSIVHVSTAYANCHLPVVDEVLYDYSVNSEEVGNLLDKLNINEVEEIKSRLMGPWPNPYCFTKALAESYIKQDHFGLPIGVFRPSIVISTYKEPIESWIDNLYGPTGIWAGILSGSLRVAIGDLNAQADLVPGDTCVAALIACAWDIAAKRAEKESEVPVYNYVCSPENSLTWGEFMTLNKKYSSSYPLKSAKYSLISYTTTNLKLYWLLVTLLELIPAFLMDAMCIISGRRPKAIAAYKKIHYFVNAISYFSLRSFVFKNNNVKDLWEKCNDVDRNLFPFSMSQVKWLEYMRHYLKGVRVYLMKDPMSTLEAAKQKHKRLQMLHFCLTNSLVFLSILFIWKILASILAIF